MTFKLIGTIIFCACFTCSCYVPRIGYTSASELKKGTSTDEVLNYLSDDGEMDFLLNVQGYQSPVNVKVYRRWIDQGRKYDLFAFTYVDGKLYHWGNIDDYKRSEDKRIEDLGIAISKAVMEE